MNELTNIINAQTGNNGQVNHEVDVFVLGCSLTTLKSLSVDAWTQTEGRVSVTSNSNAPIWVVDVEGIGGEEALKSFVPDNAQTKIIAVSREPLANVEHQIQKPLSVKNLLEAIDTMSMTNVQTSSQSNQAPLFNQNVVVVSNKERKERQLFLDFFINTLQQNEKLVKKNEAVKIRFSDNQWIIVNYQQRAVFSTLRKTSLCHMGKLSKGNIRTQVETIEFSIPENYKTSMHIDDLLWEMAGYAYPDYLLEDVKLNKQYKLKRWPNVAKVSVEDALFPLIAKWTNEPMQPGKILASYAKHYGSIIKFINQCHVTGLFEDESFVPVSRFDDEEVTPIKDAFRSIVSAINSKLKKYETQ